MQDILLVGDDRAELLSDCGVEGPPDLVVEVLSPSAAGRDRVLKLDRYRRFGVPEYWIVDREEGTVEVWKLAERAQEPLVPGGGDVLRWAPGPGEATLELPLAELFEE